MILIIVTGLESHTRCASQAHIVTLNVPWMLQQELAFFFLLNGAGSDRIIDGIGMLFAFRVSLSSIYTSGACTL